MMQEHRTDWAFRVLLLSVALSLAYLYYSRVENPHFQARLALHEDIISGTADSPYRYRVLVPAVAESLMQVLQLVLPKKASFLVAYGAINVISLYALLASLFCWLREWFSEAQALSGVLFVSSTISVTMQNHYYQPWSFMEVAIFIVAIHAMLQKRFGIVVCSLIVASFIRETALFIAFASLFLSESIGNKDGGRQHIQKSLMFSLALLGIWSLIFLGLRVICGSAEHVESLKGLFERNTKPKELAFAVLHTGLFLGGVWLYAARGLKSSPWVIRRLAWLGVVYAGFVLVWGVWIEVRLWMMLYPIVLPAALFSLYHAKTPVDH